MNAAGAILVVGLTVAIEIGFGFSKVQSKLDSILGQAENANDTLASLLTLAESEQESDS